LNSRGPEFKYWFGHLGLISWADMAPYSLFVLKVPLNQPNQPTNLHRVIEVVNYARLRGWEHNALMAVVCLSVHLSVP